MTDEEFAARLAFPELTKEQTMDALLVVKNTNLAEHFNAAAREPQGYNNKGQWTTYSFRNVLLGKESIGVGLLGTSDAAKGQRDFSADVYVNDPKYADREVKIATVLIERALNGKIEEA